MTAAAAKPSVPVADRLLLRLPEAAQLLSISESVAYDLAARGVLPTVVFNGARRVPRKALDELVETLRAEAQRSESQIRTLVQRGGTR